jgi:ABC-type transporter Mla MlaB component
MLRITVHEAGTSWRMQLEGKLAGDWVLEAENTWRSAPVSGKQIEIDLTDVTAIDDAGQNLLQAMHQAGARFVAEGVAMTALICEISGTSSPSGGCSSRIRRLVCLLTLLLMVPAVSLRAQNVKSPAPRQNPQVGICQPESSRGSNRRGWVESGTFIVIEA